MSNLGTHLAIGAGSGAGTYLLMCKYYGRKPDLGEALVSTGIGMLAAAAPDVLEPAVSPNHRAFGHSLTLGAGLVRLALTQCSKESGSWQEIEKILLAVALVSYLSRLVADGCTPRGLPLLSAP